MDKNNYSTLASATQIANASESLTEHGITVITASNGKEAVEKVLSLIPEGKEVMTATSTTLNQLGLTQTLNDSGKFDSIKSKLTKLNRETDERQMQRLGAAPEYVVGSVHAVTEDGKVVVASGSGSQLPAYTFGASHVIWVVSTKKIVKNLDSAFERINTHVLPQEDARMKEVYGPESGSNVNKLFILQKELNPARVTLIFVKENLGF